MELARENEDLRRRLNAGADLEAFKLRYRYEENVSWKYDDTGRRIDGPYCPNCVDEGKGTAAQPWGDEGHLYVCRTRSELHCSRPRVELSEVRAATGLDEMTRCAAGFGSDPGRNAVHLAPSTGPHRRFRRRLTRSAPSIIST